MSGEPENGGSKAGRIVGAALGFAIFLGCAAKLISAGAKTTDDRKTMKAPGQPGRHIYRDDFEVNPKKYFSDRRKK